MARLSAHFDSREFACKHCGRLPGKPPYSLLAALEKARTRHYPKGMVIRSGYRCPTHNAAVGGKKGSRHVAGDAADIAPVMTLKQARDCGFRGIGVDVRGRVVHVDMRPVPAVWRYDENGRTP